MALEIKIRTTSYSADNADKRIYFEDVTGAYDAQTNTTGYGGPNPLRVDVGIFAIGSAFTILSQGAIEVPLLFTGSNTDLPSEIDNFYLEAPVDGNYSVEYVGIGIWSDNITYPAGQVVYFNELMYITDVEIPFGGGLDPSVNPLWVVVPEIGEGTTIKTVIQNPSNFDFLSPSNVHPGHTIVLSTMVSDRRYVDMVTAKENLTCFFDGTLDDDSITNYRVFLYGAKANAFVECDINGVYLLRACNDIYKAAKIRCSNLV